MATGEKWAKKAGRFLGESVLTPGEKNCSPQRWTTADPPKVSKNEISTFRLLTPVVPQTGSWLALGPKRGALNIKSKKHPFLIFIIYYYIYLFLFTKNKKNKSQNIKKKSRDLRTARPAGGHAGRAPGRRGPGRGRPAPPPAPSW